MDSFSLLRISATLVAILCTLLFFVYKKKFKSNPQNKSTVSSSSRNWEHHVFSSFRSDDVPISFSSRIRNEFRRKGLEPFTDSEIQSSVSIGPELRNAIRGSRIAIVILSRNYVSSLRCLSELVEIMKCREDLGQSVVTIFYELDPIDVMKQAADLGEIFRKAKEETERYNQALAAASPYPHYPPGMFGDCPDKPATKQSREFGETFRETFGETCERYTEEDIARWSKALVEVATIDGYHSRNWDDKTAMVKKIANDMSQSSYFEADMENMLCLESDEKDMVEEIASDNSNKLNMSTPSSDFHSLVGMEGRIEKLKQMLRLDSSQVMVIGICGLPGSGKTTIAQCIYQQLFPQFQLSTIMTLNARTSHDEYKTKQQLQTQLFSQPLNQKCTDEVLILGVAKDRLKYKKVLVVLDDVDSLGQLDALAKETMWFGPGSRIIITAHDQTLLKAHMIDHIYEVDLPPPDEALQIFCIYAFGQKSPYDGFEKLAREVTTLSGELPLGLRLMGSYFRGMPKEEWKSELPRLRTSLDGKIGSIIKFTYVSLSDEDKELSHRHITHLRDDELTERMEKFLAKGFLEVRQDCIMKSQDLKEDIYTSKRALQGISNGLLHTVYIYCDDTLQYSFASHLSMNFRRKGIDAFVNCNETLDVIERVSASVVVLSKSCFSSTSYVDNLVRILQFRRTTSQLVVPVFYGISPSDVMVHEHESVDQNKEWSTALHKLRELPGHQSREECSECELVEEIVKAVHQKLFPTEQIGISSRLLEIEHLLCKQPWGIRRLGIWGMPGIGKTTLAKAIFDQISGGYEASCFIKHFDKAFIEKGVHCLLEEHFGEILKELPRVCSSITRPSLPGDKLNKKRTLVVLDDVKNPFLSESFLGGIHWFSPGSLIIITSRDKQAFYHCQINHVYEVRSLTENEGLQLFYHCACVKDMREQNLLKLSMEVVDYANGNPLALRFYGGELKGKTLSEMEITFIKLKLFAPYKIHELFTSSYETLNDFEKNIFLDIACFFKGENVDYVIQLLEGCGFFPRVGIHVLVQKCLVTISENKLTMPRIIQDFGREVNNEETVQIEQHRRLWEPSTIKFLLEDDEHIVSGDLKANGGLNATYTRALGTEDIEGIFLDTSNLIFDVKPDAFENMLSLRFLKIYCSSYENHSGLRLPKGLESLPYELRLLHWENYPLQSLPQDFDPCHLVELNLSYSQLQKLWEGTKNLEKLKIVRLCHSQQLTEINDICKAQNIELIDLQGCRKLHIFPAMCQLKYLRVVNISGCTEIKSFPQVSPYIEELHLQGTSIKELPISTVTLSLHDREHSNLLTEFQGVSNALNHDRSRNLVKAVSANQHLGKLVCLNMKDCVQLKSLPHMGDLESLKVLDLSGCLELEDIQSFPRNLKELYLSGTAIKELPLLPLGVEVVNAHSCASLISIPNSFEQLPRYYTFSNCFALSAQVVHFFVKSALTNVERIARKYQQEQYLNKSLAFSFTVPSPARGKITFDMHSGSSVMIQLSSSWRKTLGFAILVEVTFSEDYQEDSGFGISCVYRWKDKNFVSHRLEKNFHCWTPGEGVPKDHVFVFCDFNMHPSTCKGNESNDPSILADLVVFEFCTVSNQKKFLKESCTVTKCGVSVINAADLDTSTNVTEPFSSSNDYLQELSDIEVRDVLRVIHDGLDENERTLFVYIACLFNDGEANSLAPLIASNSLGISSGLKVLADKSLIHISPYGVLLRHGLLQKIGREIVHRQSTLSDSLLVLDRDFRKVIYEVLPPDVRQQIGNPGRAFRNTRIRKSDDEKHKRVKSMGDVANIVEVDFREWYSKANMIENLPHSFKMHSSMCIKLKNFVFRIMRIFPDIEVAQPAGSSGIQTLALLYKSLEKTKLLLQYCTESSKIYMAVTGDAVLSRGYKAIKSLDKSLTDFQSMIPSDLAMKVSQIVQDLRSTELTLESSEEDAGKAVRELMRRGTSSSVSSDEIRDFHVAALKLQLSTPEDVVIERRSLNSLLEKLGECEVNKRQILKYLLSLLKKHEKMICADHKENSFSHRQSINDNMHANVADAVCSEERNATLPEQFKCPLSLAVMYDPVIISSGHTFERMWIQKWFEEGNTICPESKRTLDDFTLEPNVAIKNQISKWCEKRGLGVQDPVTKHTEGFHNIDFPVSIASFGSSLYSTPDISCHTSTDSNSSYSMDSSFSFEMSKGGSTDTESSLGEIEIDPLYGLTNLPWDAQIKLIEDVRNRFEHNTWDFLSMSPSKFLEPLITYLKTALERNDLTAGDIIKGGLNLLLAFLSGNRRAIESLQEDVFKILSAFLESEVVAEEALNILEVLSNHPHDLSKITSSGCLSSLLKITESHAEHLQEQAMITLKNLSSSREICTEMVSLNFIQKLRSFLQQKNFCKYSIIILGNLCNTEEGQVCITETPVDQSCSFPPGFRFNPTDEELVGYYLRRKVASQNIHLDVIRDIDLYRIEPWDLQERCRIGYGEQNEWYFFSHNKKDPTGTRANRATMAGFWKVTGRDQAIYDKSKLIGMRKTLVFCNRRASNAQKGGWIMHEYRLNSDENAPAQEEGWVVCRVLKKSPTTGQPKKTETWRSNYFYDKIETGENAVLEPY